jgi:hypothetical protein
MPHDVVDSPVAVGGALVEKGPTVRVGSSRERFLPGAFEVHTQQSQQQPQ